MKQAFIMVGVPGSGKSTYVKKLLAVMHDCAVFSLDDCRLQMYKHLAKPDGDNWGYSDAFGFVSDNPKEFDAWVSASWKEILQHESVIVDNTNLTRKSRARWATDLRAKNFNIAAVEIMVPLEVALARQATRGDKFVPEDVIRKMYMMQQEVLVGSEADAIIVVDGTAETQHSFGQLFTA